MAVSIQHEHQGLKTTTLPLCQPLALKSLGRDLREFRAPSSLTSQYKKGHLIRKTVSEMPSPAWSRKVL
ncbi:uncharacterized protein METZ01_LOCUS77524 [marine metagenome]|uniref:Uncharacterized protein n=1 Tax=marine metagenome TaxID=408172 RepID=A0A381U8X3_9ZZZZ